MFGVVYTLEPYTVTILTRGCCIVKLQKVFLNGLKVPLEIGLEVCYDVEITASSKLPKLLMVRAEAFDSCGNCNKSQEVSDAQQVNILNNLDILRY